MIRYLIETWIGRIVLLCRKHTEAPDDLEIRDGIQDNAWRVGTHWGNRKRRIPMGHRGQRKMRNGRPLEGLILTRHPCLGQIEPISPLPFTHNRQPHEHPFFPCIDILQKIEEYMAVPCVWNPPKPRIAMDPNLVLSE